MILSIHLERQSCVKATVFATIDERLTAEQRILFYYKVKVSALEYFLKVKPDKSLVMMFLKLSLTAKSSCMVYPFVVAIKA